jgi:hypothetical protein
VQAISEDESSALRVKNPFDTYIVKFGLTELDNRAMDGGLGVSAQ